MAPPPASGDATLDALRDGRVALAVGPQLGLAVLRGTKPEAMLLALTILSPQGQKIFAASGFETVALPDER